MNKEKLVLSLQKRFRCSRADALAWASDIIASESMANGRLGSFQEFAESTAGGEIGPNLSEQVKARAKAKAGIKSFRNRDEIDEFKSRIAYRGGVRA